MTMEFYRYICYFFIYAFFGWCVEVCFAAFKHGTFVNRGFLNGPVCPIYGVGVCIVVLILSPLKHNFLLLFLGSVLLTSALEWLTGFVLEKVFHQKWWDYSDMPFNLQGYICPLFSVLWGLACLLIMDMVHPGIEKLVAWLPLKVGIPLVSVLGLVFLVDIILTVMTMLKLNQKLRSIDELSGAIKNVSDRIGKNLSDSMLDIAEKSEPARERAGKRKAELEFRLAEAKEKYTFGQKRILKAFPHFKSLRHEEALQMVKGHLEERKKKKKEYSKR